MRSSAKLSASALPPFGLVSTVQRGRRAISSAIGLARNLEGAVVRAVVDHDDAQVLVVRVQHGADGAHDDLLFVVGGDEHGDARAEIAGDAGIVALAQAIDDGEDADEHSRALISTSPMKKTMTMKLPTKAKHGKRNGVDARLPALIAA